jgi:lysophospholipase L1-like esterase
VAAVREAYPVAHIFCMRPLNGTHAKEILAAVERLAATDDKKVHYADTSGWIDPKTDTTDGLHPNVEGHRCVAEKLAVVIQQVLSERTR